MPTSSNKPIPKAIKNLQLCRILRNCGHTPVELAFNECKDKICYVFDHPQNKVTEWTNIQPVSTAEYFIADNPQKVSLSLLPLDNKIITGQSFTKNGVCDCLLLTEKELCFAEFKTNVTSNSTHNITSKADDAIQQLYHTYCVINTRHKEVLNNDIKLPLSFYVVFNELLNVTHASSELQDKQLAFLESYKQRLFFENHKTFK